MYKCLLLLLLPCVCFLLILLPFYELIPGNFWHQTDPYLLRRTTMEKTCRDFKKQIERDEAKRARVDHPPDPNVLVVVSPKERFLWCQVPKVETTNTSWKTYFLKHSGKNGAVMESRNGSQITTLSWLRFEHPAFIFDLLDIKREMI